MRISEVRKGNVVVVTLTERLDSVTSPELEHCLNRLVQSGERMVLLNCEPLSYLSSAGLRVFLSTAKKLQSAKGTFMLCSPGGIVKEVLQMSGFYDMLNIYDSEDKALAEM